jgi:hypothetical protein
VYGSEFEHLYKKQAERVSKKCCPELTCEPLSEIFCAVSFELETEAAKMRVVGFSDYSP